MKILLIDGHALFREGLRHILQQLPGGVDEILEAGSFLEGLKLAEQHSDLDLVLLELESPGSKGVISAKLFLQHYPHIPVVVVSGEEDCRVIKELLLYGTRGFVCKSSTGAILLSALSVVFAGNVYVPMQLLQYPATAVEDKDSYSIGRNSRFKEYGLTTRQIQVLKCLADGLSNKEISGAINLAEGTVKVHVAAVYQTLGIRKRTEAAQIAKQLGFITCL